MPRLRRDHESGSAHQRQGRLLMPVLTRGHGQASLQVLAWPFRPAREPRRRVCRPPARLPHRAHIPVSVPPGKQLQGFLP